MSQNSLLTIKQDSGAISTVSFPTITEYVVVCEDGIDTFNRKIIQMLMHGYVPYGNVSFQVIPRVTTRYVQVFATRYVQAFAKYS